MPERSLPVTRRHVLQQLGKAALFVGLTVASGNVADLATQQIQPPSEGVKFASSQLGTALNIRNLVKLGVKTEDVLALPYGGTRVPIAYDLVGAEGPGKYNWEITDRVMDLACRAGKVIELQIGAKTIGWPEVNVPGWFLDQFGYLDPEKIEHWPWPKKPIAIDSDPKAREYILDYAEAAAKRYLTGRWAPFVRTIFGENEAFSQNLEVSGRRYISFEFYEEELKVVKSYDRENRPVVQNPPFDTPSAILYVVKHADIIGFNYYNNIGENALVRVVRWHGIKLTSVLARSLGKQIRFTEYPGGPWVDEHGKPVHPFYWSRFFEGLDDISDDIKPSQGVYIWGPEVTLASKNKDHIRNLFSIVNS